jgi:hypothetical protein
MSKCLGSSHIVLVEAKLNLGDGTAGYWLLIESSPLNTTPVYNFHFKRRWSHIAFLPVGEGHGHLGFAIGNVVRNPHGAVE